MGNQPNDEKQKQAINKDLEVYRKLKRVKEQSEFGPLFDLMVRTASEKMVWTFTGDNIKSYDDFLKVRGEIVAYLYLLQEVGSSDGMVAHLQETLNQYYK